MELGKQLGVKEEEVEEIKKDEGDTYQVHVWIFGCMHGCLYGCMHGWLY